MANIYFILKLLALFKVNAVMDGWIKIQIIVLLCTFLDLDRMTVSFDELYNIEFIILL